MKCALEHHIGQVACSILLSGMHLWQNGMEPDRLDYEMRDYFEGEVMMVKDRGFVQVNNRLLKSYFI